MSDVSDDDALELDTARVLSDRGLIGPAFDLEAVVTDLRSRLELDASLDELVGRSESP